MPQAARSANLAGASEDKSEDAWSGMTGIQKAPEVFFRGFS